MYGVDDTLYLANNYSLDSNQGSNILSAYDINTRTFKEYELENTLVHAEIEDKHFLSALFVK